MQNIKAAFDGIKVGQLAEGNRLFDIHVVLPPHLREQPHHLLSLPLRTQDNRMLTLGDVAELQQVSGRHAILHHGAQRLQTITCNVTGRDLRSFFNELQQRVHQDVQFDADTYPEFTGTAVAEAESRKDLMIHSILVGLIVLILLYMALRSVRNTWLVLLNLPFSLLGGVVAAWLTGGVLSIGSLVGFVTLFGITLRNAIMLVSHYQHLIEHEGKAWVKETAIQGALERLPSILITALVTALAMLPIAINADSPGREIMGPMAAIIIGGLISSTLLTLLVLPSVMLRYGEFNKQRLTQTETTMQRQ